MLSSNIPPKILAGSSCIAATPLASGVISASGLGTGNTTHSPLVSFDTSKVILPESSDVLLLLVGYFSTEANGFFPPLILFYSLLRFCFFRFLPLI